MENISIALVTDNRGYGRAFALAILNICKNFEVNIFEKDEFLRSVKICGQSARSSLRDEYDLIFWDGNEVCDIHRGNVVFMADRPSLAMRNFKENKYSVYKYDTARDMVGNILEIYSGLTGNKPVYMRRDNVRIFTFCSGRGGCGCTTLAMAAGQEFVRFYGRKVLYISFENLESTGEFMECRSGVKPLGRYLYNLFRETEGVGSVNVASEWKNSNPQNKYIESYLIQDDFGLEAFAPTPGKNPLADMNENETLVFLSSVIETGKYDTLIIDIGSCLNSAAMTCLEMSERICLVSGESGAELREDHYLRYLMWRMGESVAEKTVKVRNMARGTLQQSGDSSGGGEDIIMDADICVGHSTGFVYEKNVKKILLEDAFETDVRKVAERIAEP